MKKVIFTGHKCKNYLEAQVKGRLYAYYDEGDELEIQKEDESDNTFFCKRISDGSEQWVDGDEIREVEIPEEKTFVNSRVAFFDKEETFENCTVQILTNTKTGETSVGWWKNE